MKLSSLFGALALVAAAACSATGPVTEEGPDAPDLDTDSAEEKALLTLPDGWTLDAKTPVQTTTTLRAKMVLGGPAGSTRKAGVCLLGLQKNGPSTCNTAADCVQLPPGDPGYVYCTQANAPSPGTKKCWVRNGSQTTHCAGSPANGGVPIAPGTYTTPPVAVGQNYYLSYACVEGCFFTDPSSSSASLSFVGGSSGGPR